MPAETLSVVIPVFNEERNIPLIHAELAALLQDTIDYEILFINDGSTDGSLRALNALVAVDPRTRIVNLTRNFGHQAALSAGMDHAHGDLIVTMDCDLQDPPSLILEMIKKRREGALVVLARRRTRKDGFFKKYSAKVYYYVLGRFSAIDVVADIGDYRLLDRRVLTELKHMRETSRYLRGMVAWLGFDYTIIDYDRVDRVHGKTGFSLAKMTTLAMHGILSSSLLPLRLGCIVGLLCISAGCLFFAYISVDAVFHHVDYPLYKWLVVALLILVGFLFILLWIVAEYIGRIYDEVKARPLYVVRDTQNIA